MKMHKLVGKGPNFVAQRPAKPSARSNTAYFMSRKRRVAKGLPLGKKTIRGAARRSG